MEYISLDDLLSMVDGYATGKLKQPRPIIIWVDSIERELLRMDPHGDIVGFAGYLASLYPTASATYVPGSPLTGHKYSLTDKGVRAISDELRQSFTIDENVIKHDSNGNLITRLYIHSPFSARIGENGLNSLEYGQMLHDYLGISVILMYPLDWKERFSAEMSGYDQFLCQGNKEEQLKLWLEDAESYYKSGLQVVDNFYLDFLRQCPKEYVSVDFELEKPQGVTYCSYQRWEATSHGLVQELYDILFGWWTEATKENLLILSNLFLDGNLNITALEEQLNKIKDEDWSKRVKNWSIENIEPEYERLSRIGVTICHLCGKVKYENIPSEVCSALWNFHKQKNDKGEPYNIWRMSEKEYAIAKEQEELEEWFDRLYAKAKGPYANRGYVSILKHRVKIRITYLDRYYESIGKVRPVGPNEEKYYTLNDSKN